jgi:hypothetical protein
MPAAPDSHSIVLNTLGKLLEAVMGCSALALIAFAYIELMREPSSGSAAIDIDLPKLVAERGAASSCIRMEPVPCPRCGHFNTEYRITTPPYRR